MWMGKSIKPERAANSATSAFGRSVKGRNTNGAGGAWPKGLFACPMALSPSCVKGLMPIRVAVGLVVEEELLGRVRTVGQRCGDDEPVIPSELAAHLESQCRSRRVAGDKRWRDAETSIRLAIPVLDAKHRFDLADENGRTSRFGGQPFELCDIHIEGIAQREIA